MSKKILHIVSTAYRASLEEQDDTILWLSQSMKNNGAEIDILLRGTAVNYGIINQDASGLRIGKWQQKNPPNFVRDLKKILEKGSKIFFIAEDAAHLGLEQQSFLSGLQDLSEKNLPKLFSSYDFVWNW